MVGIGKGADAGILIKDAESLETAHRVNAVVLDKTGTITIGEPVVQNIEWSREINSSDYGKILHAIQKNSEHPLADPVVKYLERSGITDGNLKADTESITGMGISASVEGRIYYSGNRKLMDEKRINIDEELLSISVQYETEAKTVFFFSDAEKALAVIAVSDRIRESSAAAIRQLQSMGIEVHMLTGDNIETARSMASEAGIDHFRAGALPQDKHDYIRELQKQGKITAMAGDGINDSQALAQADVSIAMGKGSDIAMDIAKMTIISSDLTRIPAAIKLSRQIVTTIRQNLFWAFIYNIIGIPVAAGLLYPFTGFLLNPMIAGAAMALSSVSVVTNSLRLHGKSLEI